MYIPSSFVETDATKLHEFIESHSFAILVTQGSGGSLANHLPLLLDRGAGERGKLVGHMARANGQWKDADGTEALAIFHGPHTYISPRWYAEKNVVPTWNYVAIHVYGTVRIVSDRETLLQTLRDTVEMHEADAADPWRIDKPDEQFLEGLLDSIVGFEIEISRMEGKWKLSQNHAPERRTRVIDALREAAGAQGSPIAELMSQTLGESQ